jgi:uncharacterized protein
MKLRGLTLVLNERCNYRCAYCYKALEPGAPDLSPALARRALDDLWPFLTRDFGLTFAGGEPLLSLDTLRAATDRSEELARGGGRPKGKRARYALTTNGSLIDGPVLDFLARHRFAVTLSFDGLAQDAQRKAGSFGATRKVLEALRSEPRIALGVHSVFTPASAALLSRSLGLLIGWETPRISFAFSIREAWDASTLARLREEMGRLRRMALDVHARTGAFPLDLFSDERPKGVFACAAGQEWLSLSPDGRLWGCSLFADHFRGRERTAEARAFCFGRLGSFRREPERAHARHAVRYARLSQDNFRTADGPCFLCPEVERCEVCPLAAALAGSPIGTIPRSLCEIQRIKSREVARFRAELGHPARRP